MRHAPAVRRALVIALSLCAPAAARAQHRFEVLGNFWPAGVSDDGNTVAGTGSDPAAPGQVMVLWTPGGGLRTAGWSQGHEHTSAHAISGDGSTILGVDYNANMLVWTAAGGIFYPPGTNNSPGGVNRDGSVVVGGHVGGGPFRWTAAGGAAPLPTPPGWADNGADGRANAVSADGSVVAGTLFNSPGHRRPFVWTAAAGTTLLDLPGGIAGADATAVSDDGSAITGWAYDAGGVEHAFRWTAAGGMHLLGHLPGYPNTPALSHASSASDLTADGSVVVGTESNGPHLGDGGAFVWDAVRGMRDLKTVLTADYGLDLSGWTLWSASGITPGGHVIVGMGSHPQFGESVAWRAVLPEPAAGVGLVGLCCVGLRRRRRR